MTPIGTLVAVLDQARAWPVASQQTARRNAMIACTAMAQRRAEREDVDDYLAALVPVPPTHADAAHG